MSRKITFLPMNKTVAAEDGMTFLEVAELHYIPMMHDCGGCCACSTCHCIVEAGTERHASPMEQDEAETLESLCADATPASRLGCQAKVNGGDVVVRIMNVAK